MPITLTLEELQALLNNSSLPQRELSSSELRSDHHPWEIGANYLIRTVTMTLTGRLTAVASQELVLVDAAWIADTGRFADALRTGVYNEVEPFPAGSVIVGRGAVVDAVRIDSLPLQQR